MNKKLSMFVCTVLMFAVFSVLVYSQNNTPGYLPLYDFNSNDNNSKYKWDDITDQVMGGVSEGYSGLVWEGDEYFLRLRGDVSLKNNGGFIQTRLTLASGFSVLNAGDYDGVRLLVRGQGSGYYLFFRTSATFFPWLYYAAAVKLDNEWQIVDVPWSAVGPGDSGDPGKFDPSKLKSIALVAYGKEFSAEVDLKKIGLYRN